MKRLLFFMIMLFSAVSLMADDGHTINVENWSYGNIYSKESDDMIALEKELMICSMDSITAIFVFKNTTDDTVTVDCAFPIDLEVPYKNGSVNWSDDSFEYAKSSCYSYRALKILLGTKDSIDTKEVIDNEGYISLNDRVMTLVQTHDKELRVMSRDQYFRYLDSLNLKDAMSSTYFFDLYTPNCDIQQDGKSVKIENVGIESTVSSDLIKMQLHFHHQLTFLPNSYSKVVIKNAIDRFADHYTYDISTGGTWKGNIHSFMVFAQRCHLTQDKSTLKTLCLNELNEYGIYYKKEYKPKKGEIFRFSNDFEAHEHDVYSHPKYEDLKSVPLKELKTSSSWNNPKAMMDKDRFTACAITDWQNASLEFTIPQDAYGPFMYNGSVGNIVTKEIFNEFRDSMKQQYSQAWDSEYNISDFFPDDSTVKAYNRVSKISVELLDEPYDTLLFDVSFSDPRKFPFAFDWDRFNDVKNMRYFSAGRYRLTIKDIVKGWQCQDTTLITEFCFLKVPKDISDMLADDAISDMTIFDDFVTMLDPSLMPVQTESTKSQADSVEVAQADTIPSEVITATPKIVIMNQEIPLYVLLGAVAFVLLIIGGCAYYQKRNG